MSYWDSAFNMSFTVYYKQHSFLAHFSLSEINVSFLHLNAALMI